MNKAVFLDRDGVLNQSIIREGRPYPPQNISEIIIPDNTELALNKLKQQGFLLLAVTNQPDVARGDAQQKDVEAINAFLMSKLPLDKFYVCYHDNQDNCQCRKPLPGMLIGSAAENDIDLAVSFMVGDRWKDIEAGKKAGCKSVFLDFDYAEDFATSTKPDFTTDSLLNAANWIMSQD